MSFFLLVKQIIVAGFSPVFLLESDEARCHCCLNLWPACCSAAEDATSCPAGAEDGCPVLKPPVITSFTQEFCSRSDARFSWCMILSPFPCFVSLPSSINLLCCTVTAADMTGFFPSCVCSSLRVAAFVNIMFYSLIFYIKKQKHEMRLKSWMYQTCAAAESAVWGRTGHLSLPVITSQIHTANKHGNISPD